MSRFGFAVVLPLLFVVLASAQDKDAVTIKISYPKAGQRAKVTIEDKTTTKTEFSVGGNAQSKNEIKTKSLVYVDEIIENPKNEKKATKLKRTYEKAVLGKDGNDTKLPIEGMTVSIEKMDGKYSFTIDGQAVTGESLKLLEEEFNKPDQKDTREVMFPKTPVKPGETWKIDTAEMLKAIGSSGPVFEKEKVTASGTLAKAYKKDGKQYGVIDFVFEAPITSFGEKSPLMVKEGKMTMKMSGDGCIDGSRANGKSTTKITLDVTGTTQGIDLKIAVDGLETRTMEELPKK